MVFFNGSRVTKKVAAAAFIFQFYNIRIWQPRVRLLIVMTTKLVGFISNIDEPLTTPISILIWVDSSRSPSNEQSCCCSLHLPVLQHRNWRASISVVDRDDYQVAKLYLKYWWIFWVRLSLFLSELIFKRSGATKKLSAASLHNLILQHRN